MSPEFIWGMLIGAKSGRDDDGGDSGNFGFGDAVGLCSGSVGDGTFGGGNFGRGFDLTFSFDVNFGKAVWFTDE